MDFKLYKEVTDAWDAMIEDIDRAERQVLLLQFLIKDLDKGQVGKRLIDALARASRRGVEVHLIIDAYGSLKLYFSDMIPEGVNCTFHDIHPKWRHRIFASLFRDHRKLLVVDDKIVHIGGVVFLDKAEDWLDLQVRFADEVIAKDAERLFVESRREFSDLPHSKVTSDYFIWQGLGPKSRELTYTLLKRLSSAKEQIRILTPYFSPPRKFQRILMTKVKEGVRVQVIVPLPSDRNDASSVTKHYFRKFSRAGVECYALQEKMCHGKMIQVDNWSTFGSVNFDRLSLHYNYELNFWTDNPLLHGSLSKYYDELLELADRVRGKNIHLSVFEKMKSLLLRSLV